MRKDPTAFRERFKAYKDGRSIKDIYNNGLPGYAEGTLDDYTDTMNFLKQHEGFRDTTYLDGKGIPTIGYGFTDPALVKKGRISEKVAEAKLRQAIITRDANLKTLKNWDKLGDGAKTALRSYYYNYPAGFKNTTKFIKAWNAGDYAEAIRQVDAGMNDTANTGLRTRRLAEQELLSADPYIQSIINRKPLSKTTIAEENAKMQFQPWENYHGIDYPMNNPAPASISSWNSPQSPAYTPSLYNASRTYLQLPDLVETLQSLGWQPGFADGKSPIHIKPANRGKFTALKKRTGHSASWFKKNGTPAQKKMATFALNARKWSH